EILRRGHENVVDENRWVSLHSVLCCECGFAIVLDDELCLRPVGLDHALCQQTCWIREVSSKWPAHQRDRHLRRRGCGWHHRRCGNRSEVLGQYVIGNRGGHRDGGCGWFGPIEFSQRSFEVHARDRVIDAAS